MIKSDFYDVVQVMKIPRGFPRGFTNNHKITSTENIFHVNQPSGVELIFKRTGYEGSFKLTKIENIKE